MDQTPNPLQLPVFLLLVTLALASGCAGESGNNDDDPGDACDGLCEAIDGCDPELTDDEACEDMCDGVKALEDELSASCQEAIADLMHCAAELRCEILELDDELDDPHYLDNIFDDCAPELEEMEDECEGQFGVDDDDD